MYPLNTFFHYVSVDTSEPVNPRKQKLTPIKLLNAKATICLKISISILMNSTESNEPHRRMVSSSMLWSKKKNCEFIVIKLIFFMLGASWASQVITSSASKIFRITSRVIKRSRTYKTKQIAQKKTQRKIYILLSSLYEWNHCSQDLESVVYRKWRLL